jgi:hypothetical protein
MYEPALRAAPCQVGWLTNTTTGEVIPAKCKAWVCPDCGPRRARAYRKRIEPIGWTYLLTFTLEGPEWAANRGKGTAYTREQVKEANRRWRMLRQWMRRNLEGRNFVWVNELGERTGRLHRHCLLDVRRFQYARLRCAAIAAGFGRIMRFDKLRSTQGGCSYVTKYLTAGLGVRWPRGARRIQTSAPCAIPQDVWIYTALPKLAGKLSWWSERRIDSEIARRNEVMESDRMRGLGETLNLTLKEKVHHVWVPPD